MIALAVVGACVAFGSQQRLARNRRVFLALVALLNFLGAVAATGTQMIAGFHTGLVSGGFILALFVVVSVLAALGATWVVDELAQWAQSKNSPKRLPARQALAAAAIGVGLVVVVPSLVVHHQHASHRTPPLADRYAQRVLDELPPNAMLLTWGEEYGAPIVYRQVVHGERPDVTVVNADQFGLDWYREQLARRLGERPVDAPEMTPESMRKLLSAFVADQRKQRPVYLDTLAMWQFSDLAGFRTHGLVGEVVDGTGPQQVGDPDAVARELAQAEDADGIADRSNRRFPSNSVFIFHERAHIELFKQFMMKGQKDRALEHLRRANDINRRLLTTQVLTAYDQGNEPDATFVANL